MGPSCEERPLHIIALLHYRHNGNSKRANWSQPRDNFSEWRNTQETHEGWLGQCSAKSDAILLADISPRLEEKNPNGLLELELLSLEQRQIQKTKDI